MTPVKYPTQRRDENELTSSALQQIDRFLDAFKSLSIGVIYINHVTSYPPFLTEEGTSNILQQQIWVNVPLKQSCAK